MRNVRSTRHMALVAVWAAAGTVARVTAQSQDGFVAAKPGDLLQEHLPATPLVFAAYAIVWLVVVAYVLSLWRRIAKVEREIADVTAKLEARG